MINEIFNIESISGNGIGDEGAVKLGESVSKLLNLTCLNLDFLYKYFFS